MAYLSLLPLFSHLAKVLSLLKSGESQRSESGCEKLCHGLDLGGILFQYY